MNRFLWTQKQNFGPSPRHEAAMTFDAVSNRVVLFGGYLGLGKGDGTDTWNWSGRYWTQVGKNGPSDRFNAAIAFDGEKVILHGGYKNLGTGIWFNETWSWDGQDWTKLNDQGPSRTGHVMAYDERRNRVVLFGGANKGYWPDTWEWDGIEWTQVAETGPSARVGSVMAYDTVSERMILFGGSNCPNDTWEWDGTEWTQVSDMGPAARETHSLASSPSGIILFGGGIPKDATRSTWNYLGDTWLWQDNYWTQVQNSGPTARANHAMAFDTLRQCVVLFGGFNGNGIGDTWELWEK